MLGRLLCCSARDMGAALATPHEGESCDAATVPVAPPTMADVIRERKKKCGGAGLGTLRRRLVHAARRPTQPRLDKGCEHARFIRSVVSSWRVPDVFLLADELEASAALRDVTTQAELARPPAPDLHHALLRLYCDVELVGSGWSLAAPRALLAARSHYFRELFHRHPTSSRVVLEGAGAGLSRSQLAAALRSLCLAACPACDEFEREKSPEDMVDLDVTQGGVCTCGSASNGTMRRISSALQFSTRPLRVDMQRLLESGEFSDCRLVFRGEEGPSLELPCHRAILMARSRFLRWSLCRRAPSGSAAGAGGSAAWSQVAVDETLVPRRFAHALLHAVYTDQVDLSLVGRATTSPSTTGASSNAGTMSWGRGSRGNSTAMLEDAFQLYDIAKFLELSIVCQGCEDAIVSRLSAATLPIVLQCSKPPADPFIYRQALRYFRDEYWAVTSSPHVASIPREAMLHAIASPFTQASEAQVLSGLLRWMDRAPPHEQRPDRDDTHIQELLQLIRWRHIPPNCDAAKQALRRGLVEGPLELGGPDAWLSRSPTTAPRAFLPYLDQLKALLEHQPVPEAELSRVRRARYMHSIPDTLYMVSGRGARTLESLCVPAALAASLAARGRALLARGAARRALAPASAPTHATYMQVALRVVRERNLPDSCAELVLHEMDLDRQHDRERRSASSSAAELYRSSSPYCELDPGLCRGGSEGGSVRGASRRDGAESSSSSSCRREGSSRTLDVASQRSVGGRLSWRVPDVAMPPNANTHLLTVRDYFRHAQYGGILQLDLGDGAMHTPRPGSRAARASTSGHSRPARERGACSSRSAAIEDNELNHVADLTIRGAASRLATLPLPPPSQGRGFSPPSPDVHAPARHLSLSRNSSESSAGSSRIHQYRSGGHAEQHL